MNIILYTWWDGDIPFYVGVGNPGRELQWRKRNPHCYAKRKSAEFKNTFSVVIEQTDLDWEEAWDLERKRIAEIGTIAQGTGSLTNYAEGGNGGNTQVGWDEQRKREFIEKMKKVNASRPTSAYGGTGGTIWITNGTEQTRVNPDLPLPDGWRKGRLPHSGAFRPGDYWITNGTMNLLVPLDNPIPLNYGWVLGITKSHYRGKKK